MNFSEYFNNPTYLTILICIIVAFAVMIAYFVWSSYNSEVKYNSNREHEDKQIESNKIAHIMLFYADWCPHCKTAKPEWNALKEEYDGKTINGYIVVFEEYNCTEQTEDIESTMNKYDVNGYPTIKLIKDGQLIDYDAKPTKDLMEKFLNTVL